MRLDALLNEAQFIGRPPTSVAGGDLHVGKLLGESRGLRTGIGQAARGLGVDGALRRLVRIAEGGCVRQSRPWRRLPPTVPANRVVKTLQSLLKMFRDEPCSLRQGSMLRT